MFSVREKYWRYSLFVLILAMGVTIFCKLIPLLGGLLGAMTIYILLRKQMTYLTDRCQWRRSAAATLLVVETIFCFLIPMSLIIWMLVARIQDLTLNPQTLLLRLQHLNTVVHHHIGIEMEQEAIATSLVAWLSRLGQWVVRSLVGLSLNVVALLFVLYFMLIGGRRMEEYCREILPFNR
ncbi:MAG: AI-2E family transporter, partial [Alistipes sp.]|nr:AI-2E family transporter [Alistipes sp.]